MSPSGIRSWPKADRPREKLLCLGEARLTDSELLAILIQSGTKGASAVELARLILRRFGSLRGLSQATLKEWRSFKGLGPAKIAQLKAAMEISRRFNSHSFQDTRVSVESSQDIAGMFMGGMRHLKKEAVKILLLNRQNKIIAAIDAAEGTVNGARPILREIFAGALEHNASAIICVHNHPGGDPAPSPEDRRFTQELQQAGAVLDIAVLDHVIIGDNRYYSFADGEGEDQSMK